jgi:hypothetical protein
MKTTAVRMDGEADISEEMNSVISLHPNIISAFQQKILNEQHFFKIPLFVDPVNDKISQIWLQSSGDYHQFVGIMPIGTKIYSPLSSPVTTERFFNGCVYSYLEEGREDIIDFEIYVAEKDREKILLDEDKVPFLAFLNIVLFDSKVYKEGQIVAEASSTNPVEIYKFENDIETGDPIAEIISNIDNDDPVRQHRHILSTSFVIEFRLFEGKLEDLANAKMVSTTNEVLMKADNFQDQASQNITISILPNE